MRRQSRLQALEQRQVATHSDFPGYVCAESEAEAITKLAALGSMVRGAVKLYIGLDLDTIWSDDNETTEPAAET